MSQPGNESVFYESQKREEPGLWAIIAVSATVLVILAAMVIHSPQPGRLASPFDASVLWVAVPTLAALGVFLVLMRLARLETRVDAEKLHVRYRPVHLWPRDIPLRAIRDVELVRFGDERPEEHSEAWTPWGRVYKVASNTEAVVVRLENEPAVAIGSQRASELLDTLKAKTIRESETVAAAS